MSLTQDQIKKLSKKLSKLGISGEELITSKINSIMGYIEILNEIDTTGVIPTFSVSKKNNVLREDIVKKNFTRKELLDCSKQKIIGDQIAISSIMN